MVTRRRFLQTTSALAASDLAKAQAPAGQRPNILVFMPDQQQGGTVLPSSPCITPHLDRFASEGVTFTHTFCPSPHCCPSRASFMSGLYPSEHGVFNNVDTDTAIHTSPYPGIKFFSEALGRAGYQLTYSGKWHVARNGSPADRGWKNLNPGKRQSYQPGRRRQPSTWEQAKTDLQSHKGRRPGEVLRPGWGNIQLYGSYPPKGPKGYEGTGDYAIIERGVRGLQALAGGDQPWCLMVSNSGGHDRYVAPQNFVDMYNPKSVELPASFRDTLEDKPRIYQRMRYQYWAQLSDDEIRDSIAHYWAKLTMQDALFGLLLDALEKTGQAENTIVIYTSDHGDYAGAHGLWAKGVPSFREGYHIPCIIRWPRGAVQPGRTVDAFISTVDFAPTFLEAAGVHADSPLSGSSLLPWLRGETPSNWRDAAYCQLNGVELYYTQRIVMTKQHKYVYNGFDFDELYDLQRDPHEMVNLAFPNVKEARAAMDQGAGLTGRQDVSWPPLPPELDGVRRELLQKMWEFARIHKDQIFNPYLTVAMAPLGPASML
jgi:arylsulfatase A-like enzyme